MSSRNSIFKKSRTNKKQAAIEEEESEKPQAPIIEVWENTYRMEPQKRFKAHLAKKEIQKVFEEHLDDDLKYDDPTAIKTLSNTLSAEIKEKVKALDIPRYKIVVQTFVGQLKGQSVLIGSRWLWNANTDNYASVEWKNVMFNLSSILLIANDLPKNTKYHSLRLLVQNSVYVTSMVFATYLE